MRRTRLHGQLDAAEREIPAVHGALHAQRALQDAAQSQGMGVRRPEGHLRAGKPRIRHGQGRDGRGRNGGTQAQGGRELPPRGVGETTAYLLPEFPANHGIKLRTNNMIERLNKEIRRRTRVVGGFPDSNSALMLVCARIRYVTSRSWSDRRYMDMSRLDDNARRSGMKVTPTAGQQPICAKKRALPAIHPAS